MMQAMRQTIAHCQRIELLGQRVRLHFECAAALAPGQFVLARVAPAFDPYLRQPLFPSAITPNGFAADLAEDDPALRFIAPGSNVDVLTPAGSPVGDLPSASRLLLIADRTPAVLLPVAARAIEAGGSVTLLLAQPYPLDALDPRLEIRVGNLPELAADFAPTADLVFIHTAQALHRPIAQALASARPTVATGFARALLAPPMPCGTGACGACAVRTARGWKPACTEGPFFNLADLET